RCGWAPPVGMPWPSAIRTRVSSPWCTTRAASRAPRLLPWVVLRSNSAFRHVAGPPLTGRGSTMQKIRISPDLTRRLSRASVVIIMLALWGACSSPEGSETSGPGDSSSNAASGSTGMTAGDAAGVTGGTGVGGATTVTGSTSSTGSGTGGASSTAGSPASTTGVGATTGSGGTGAVTNEEYPFPANAPDESGADLWLRYPVVPIPGRLAEYQAAL